MNEKLAKALEYISDRHIAEAAEAKRKHRHPFLTAVAAILAVVLLLNIPHIPMAVSAKAISTPEYPDYEWNYRGEEMDAARALLKDFFGSSISRSLSGAGDENMTYSPINLYMALTLAAELAGGKGEQQILTALGADSMDALRHQANQVWNACYNDNNNQALLANSLWLDDDLSYNQAVMDTLAEHYYTAVYQGDLGSSRTNRAIQTWLNNQTGGLLKQETKNAGISQEAGTFPVLALYSTVYFQAKWSENVEFSPGNNTDGTFHAPGGDISCTFMNKKEMQTQYYWGADYGAVALGLKDGSRMWLILPDEDKTVEDVLASGEYARQVLQGEDFTEDSEDHKYMKVNLSLPKFDIRATGDLKSDLEALGITDVFDPEAADFSSSVEGDFPVWLTGVNQATRVAIDEKGVTAASYIEIPGAGAAMPPEEIIDFILDRPFIFIITNRYDLPLFAGVVNEP